MKYKYYEFKLNSGETMHWKSGTPCSNCGKPTESIEHTFNSGNKTWTYFAPLYHNVADKLGFCCTNCVIEWMDKNGS